MNRQTSRRRLLLSGCAMAVGVGIAGCSGGEPADRDDPGGSNRVETTEAEPAAVDPATSDFDMEYEPGASLDSNGSPWESADHDGTLTVTHAGGGPAAADRLYIVGPPSATLTPTPNSSITTAASGQWYAQAGATPDDPAAEVTQGDSMAIEVDADAEVWVEWHSPDGRSSTGLKHWAGPDA